MQTDNAEHKAHMQHTGNYRVVPPGTDKERNWMIRGHFLLTVPTKYVRILRLHTADSRVHMAHSNISNGGKG